MIVVMKKVFIFMQAKDAEETTKTLAGLGLLHIEHQRPPKGEDINALQNNLSLINEALDILSGAEFAAADAKKGDASHSDWKDTCRHIIDTKKRLEQLQNYGRALQAGIKEWQEWGDFAPQKLKLLQQKNIFVRLYRIPLKELKSLPQSVCVQKISVQAGIVNCAIISLGKPEIKFKEIALAQMGLEEMRKRFYEDEKVIQILKADLKKSLSFYSFLQAKKNDLLKQLEFQEAINGMGKSEEIMYLTGFAPAEKEQILLKEAAQNKWAIFIKDPEENDAVPTLIRNPRWIALISPIFKFLEILPGYREFDISLPFLIFFSIFFGILIGDAGYGLVYLLLTFLIQKKMAKKAKPDSFFLFYLLSLCAIIWGALTGTFFGQEWVLKAGYKPLLPALNEEKGLQRFCFFLGALHLSIAHAWRGVLKAPSLRALADLGSMCVLWAVFFIAKTLILGDALPAFCAWLIISGAALIIIFTNPGKNILKYAEEWIAWLITLPFSFIGNFADVVSYIRLFAVGLAGVAIADAFNAMAAMVGKGNMLMVLFAVFIALIGNVLGIVLGPVSVLVHGVRLNLLEFSGHMGLSWSGVAYKPLKE